MARTPCCRWVCGGSGGAAQRGARRVGDPQGRAAAGTAGARRSAWRWNQRALPAEEHTKAVQVSAPKQYGSSISRETSFRVQ